VRHFLQVSPSLPRVHPPVHRTSSRPTTSVFHLSYATLRVTSPLLFLFRLSRSPVGTPRSHLIVDECLPARQHHHHRGLVVRSSSPNDGTTCPHYSPRTRAGACRADEPGRYFTAYKQPENRLPTPIRERGQNPRCAPTQGVREHPTREQDARRNPPCVI